MKMTRCSGPDLHFFDGEKYSVCPVCGYPAATKEDDEKLLMQDAVEKKQHKEKKKWPFGNVKKEENYEPVINNDECATQAMTDVISNSVKLDDNHITTGVRTSTGVETIAMEPVKESEEKYIVLNIPRKTQAVLFRMKHLFHNWCHMLSL